jgi:hypothetical protein
LPFAKTSYFYQNTATMKLMKLTVLPLLLLMCILAFTSCEKNADKKIQTDFSKSGIVMTGAQETPATTSSALGSLDVYYTRETRILTYKFTWAGLTGPVTVFHIHGLAPVGYQAAVIQTFVTTGITPCSPNGPTSCGTYSGTLLVDGTVIKEQDLLNGLYYVNIHTAANPGGEIRGQIRFQ